MADLKIADLQVYNGTTWQEFTDTDSAITTAYKCRNNIIYLENKTDLSEEDLQNQIEELKTKVNNKLPVLDLGHIATLSNKNTFYKYFEKDDPFFSFIAREEVKVLIFSINDGNKINPFWHEFVLVLGNNQRRAIEISKNNVQEEGGGPEYKDFIYGFTFDGWMGGAPAGIHGKCVPFDVSEDINNLATTVDNLAKATPTDIKGDNGNSGDINTFHLKLQHDDKELTPQNPVLVNIPKYLYIPTGSSVELNAGFDFPATEVNATSGFIFFVIPLGSDEGATGTVLDLVYGDETFNVGAAGFYHTVNIIYHEDPTGTGRLMADVRIQYDSDFTSHPRNRYSGIPDVGNLNKIIIDNTIGDYDVIVMIMTSKISNDAINS